LAQGQQKIFGGPHFGHPCSMVYTSVSQPTGRDPVTGRGEFQTGRGGLSSK